MCVYQNNRMWGKDAYDMYVLYMHVFISMIFLELKDFIAKIIFCVQKG